MRELIFATHNAHKVHEVASLLRRVCLLRTATEAGITEPIPEEHDTLSGNAWQKAEFVWMRTGRDSFADDTGLEVEALGGAPGVYSARYAGPGCSFADNMAKLLREMRGIANRKACFRTVIALIIGGARHEFEGRVDGEILEQPTGEGGFGYDAVFRPQGYELSFAQMPLEVKNSLSHRGRAVEKMRVFLSEL